MTLEWVPSMAKLTETSMPSQVLDEHQEHTLSTALELADLDGSGDLDVQELAALIRSATDIDMSVEAVQALIKKARSKGKGDKEKSSTALMKSEVKQLLASGMLSTLEQGRYTVAVSLAEAETLRRIIHVRAATGANSPLVDGADVALALRCTQAGNMVFDHAGSFKPGPTFQTETALQVTDAPPHNQPPHNLFHHLSFTSP